MEPSIQSVRAATPLSAMLDGNRTWFGRRLTISVITCSWPSSSASAAAVRSGLPGIHTRSTRSSASARRASGQEIVFDRSSPFRSSDRQTGSYPPGGEDSSKFPRDFRLGILRNYDDTASVSFIRGSSHESQKPFRSVQRRLDHNRSHRVFPAPARCEPE